MTSIELNAVADELRDMARRKRKEERDDAYRREVDEWADANPDECKAVAEMMIKELGL